jgi:hypothetical protein
MPFATRSLGDAVALAEAGGIELRTLREQTSWSCHHGISRWSSTCDCTVDGTWKAPLRSALERLAGGIDAATEQLAARLPGAPDPWAARDAYVDVVIGAEAVESFADAGLAPGASQDDRSRLHRLMEAQRWRLAMFASCAWFWESPDRIETAGGLRAAVRAARLIDELAGTDLESRLRADVGLLVGNGHRGVELLRRALIAVGAPDRHENPSARGLRATG